MPLTYRAPGRSRERILAFGAPGTGKTTDALTIARMLPDVTFHWIDTDDSLDRLLETEFADLGVCRENGEDTDEPGNISVWRVEDWDEQVDAYVQIFGVKQKNIAPSVEPDDWVVIDNGSLPWDAVQDWAAQQIYGQTREERTEARGDERRGDKSNLLVFDGEMDYGGKINPQYRQYLGRHLTRPPCHLFVTADMAELDDRNRDKQLRGLYGSWGVMPRGQKRLGSSMQTVLLKEQRGKKYVTTTVKDRGREQFANDEVEDFAKEYLRNIAGWKPGKY